MVRTIVLGTVTFLVSLGVAVGGTMVVGGGEVDLSAALPDSASADSILATGGDSVTASRAEADGISMAGDNAVSGSTPKAPPERVDEPAGGEASERGSAADMPTTGEPAGADPSREPAVSTGLVPPASVESAPAGESDGDEGELASTAVAPADPSAPATDASGPGGDQSLPEPRLGKIFGAMQPREAARVLEMMDDRDVAVILGMLNDRQAAAIMANLSPERAARISISGLSAAEGE